MRSSTLTRLALAFVATGAVLSAQEEKKDPHAGVTKQASATVPGKTELRFNVTGLTKDNVTKVKDSLTALSFQTYICPGCKYEQSTAGKCAPCNSDLKAEKKPLLSGATPSPDDSSITLTLDQARSVRLSEIENALKGSSVQIANDKFPIIGQANLVVRGATEQDVPTVEKALRDAKLFEEVKATFDKTTNEIHVMVRAGATPPMRSAVASAIDKAGVKATLGDVVWGKPAKKA